MLRFIYGTDLSGVPGLQDSMFRHRADQFSRRLGWPVQIDARGWERDDYDLLNPLYVVWQMPDGSHGGSMRFLPTTGQNMVNDHFLHVTQGAPIISPLIWECTRFCLAPEAVGKVAGALMAAGGEIMRRFNVEHFVGVYDARMERIYRMIGARPDLIGSTGVGRDKISVGLWHYDAADSDRVLDRAGLTAAQVADWFDLSMDHPQSALQKLG